ncbi:hypothetical protein GCM10010172_77270 [Paractinoplanes ferrugineus]|uniref:Peptidase MA superfamily protein n=1 Tax=Paractinoplanes ferrugineus TaxID=113564 RepID=A0A919J914_9ACTN|nr:hypothetical protein [Actinoplanes ferrugineus]GIE12801.1 hypothetical protein Afe05nite_46410 [Actinoplanes ferrugineus]
MPDQPDVSPPPPAPPPPPSPEEAAASGIPAQRQPGHDTLEPDRPAPVAAASVPSAQVADEGPAGARENGPGEIVPASGVAAGTQAAAVGEAATDADLASGTVGAGEGDGRGDVEGVRARRWVKGGVAVVAALGVLVLGVVLLKPQPKGAAIAAPSVPPASSGAEPATPYDRAVAVLEAQAKALLAGDESGWLAAVDASKAPLVAKYRGLFRNLRGLGVTRFEYEPGLGRAVKGDATALSIRVESLYCFGEQMCPADAATEWAKPPHISQTVTMRPVGGRFVISALGASPNPDFHQPLPWESTDLVFATGKRVVVAAATGQEKYLPVVLPVAEQAAVVADRYAALNGTPQRDYRIFLAGEKQWKSWYGGEPDEWAIGLAMPLNRRGIDVIVRMSEMDDALTLRTTVQHELGHVVTLTGAFQMDAVEDTWLSEGIAEYIGWKPKGAAGSFRKYSVKWQFDRAAPKSIVPVRPGPKAPARAGDAFYGLSHWAADCMAAKYGETKLFTFVRLVLTEDNSYDQASRDAYGVPFATVDKACVSWIRKQAS